MLALVQLSNGVIISRHSTADLVNIQYDGEGRWVSPGWSNDKYALVERVMADTPLAGYVVTSETETFDGKKVVVTRTYEPAPPERRLIEKFIILDRITDTQLDDAMALMTQRQKERWRMPGKSAIYVDDEELLMLLKAIGADPEVVLAE